MVGPSVCEKIGDIVSALRAGVRSASAESLSDDDALALVDLFAEVEKLAQAGRTLAAGRVAKTHAWRQTGARTAAQYIAARAGSTVGDAITLLETAHNLGSTPATLDAFLSGRLSGVQAAEIASAASVDPGCEQTLLDLAETESVAALKERAKCIRAAAAADEDWADRIRRSRYVRFWSDRDGAVRLEGRFAPDDGAPLIAAIEATSARLRDEAQRSGIREPAEAHAADALLTLVSGQDQVRAVVHIDVDAEAFERGWLRSGETCRIRGVGPIPISAARRLASTAFVKIIARDGDDITKVAHVGRTIPATLRSALEARDPTCVVPGCDVRINLEIDHILPFALGGETRLDNLARLCRFHHGAKSRGEWALGGRAGAWTWSKTTKMDPLSAGGSRQGPNGGRSPPEAAP